MNIHFPKDFILISLLSNIFKILLKYITKQPKIGKLSNQKLVRTRNDW